LGRIHDITRWANSFWEIHVSLSFQAAPPKHQSGLPVDIVPFGGVERPDRTIAWPPDGSIVFDCFGMREAFDSSIRVALPESPSIHVPSIPALVILKFMAWSDRRHNGYKDAADILVYLSSYMDCDNLQRAALQHADLFDDPNFSHPLAGARLLGRDVVTVLNAGDLIKLRKVLLPEIDETGPLLLVNQMGRDPGYALELLNAMSGELVRSV
jgi:predicted nucleotidyltransferase